MRSIDTGQTGKPKARRASNPVAAGTGADTLRSDPARVALAELLAGERERKRLARDLHDDVGQLLALMQLKTRALRDQLHAPERAAVDAIADLIRQVSQRVASLSFQLHPPILESEGFEPAARWLAEALRESHELKVDFEDEGDLGELDRATAVVLFRCLRELLINVAKHTDTKQASVRVALCRVGVELVVTDSGRKGSSGAPRRFGYGLVSLCEQLRALGGSFEIGPGEGGLGSRARVALPLLPGPQEPAEEP